MRSEFPTVAELVDIFEARDWAPKTGIAGADAENVSRGQCCMIPALLVFEGLFDEVFQNGVEVKCPYIILQSKYGDFIYDGFDGIDAPGCEPEVHKLGVDLRNSLFLSLSLIHISEPTRPY